MLRFKQSHSHWSTRPSLFHAFSTCALDHHRHWTGVGYSSRGGRYFAPHKVASPSDDRGNDDECRSHSQYRSTSGAHHLRESANPAGLLEHRRASSCSENDRYPLSVPVWGEEAANSPPTLRPPPGGFRFLKRANPVVLWTSCSFSATMVDANDTRDRSDPLLLQPHRPRSPSLPCFLSHQTPVTLSLKLSRIEK